MSIYDVFLSYRRSDGADLARKIRDYLVEKGLRVFLDTEEMVDGLYFTTQIVDNLRQAPNYILVGTQDVFNFREGEDWVREEIALALSEYEADSTNRTVNVIVPSGVVFPDKSALPESVRNITVPNRINLSDSEPTDEEYLRLLKAVSGVNRRNLWNAGQRWLESSKKEGARFAALSIDETIMPKAKKRTKKEPEHSQMPILVYQKERTEDGYEHHTDDQQLLDALSSTQGHLYLIGEGGIGKTTSLIRIMNEAYSGRQYTENAQIPLFIELSRAPDTYGRLYEGGVSTFIRRAIYQQIRADRSVKQISSQAAGQVGDAFSIAPELAVVPVDGLLTTESSVPEYLLLLDGLNETSRTEIDEVGRSVVQMIMQEIEWIIENCPNVRVMLTSRTDEAAMRNSKITRLYLTGVDNDTIRGYLESCKLPQKRIDAVFENMRLLETLRIPLFLTMYASLKGTDEVTSRGGIFRMFFSERRENLDVYTAQSRIASVDSEIANAASKNNSARIDAKMQNFILDFLLPEIAWNMERKGLFYMDIEDIAEIIETVLTDKSDTAICGRYGKRLFTKYRNGADSAMHTQRVANSMINKLGSDFEEIAEAVVNCCTLQLGIMQESNGQHGFMHHHIRDYFAAVREVNSLRLAVYAFEQGKGDISRECLVGMKETPIHIEISRFIGEYLEEDKNAPSFADGKWNYNVPDKACDRNLIRRALDIFRGRFDGEDGYAVYSLIEVLKNVRKDLSGANLSRLDLTQCTLNGVELGKCSGTDFSGTKVNRDNLFPVGHTMAVKCVAYSQDENYIVTASNDKTVKIWDVQTGSIIRSIEGHKDFVNTVVYSPCGNYIATSSRDKTAKIWNSLSGELVSTIEGHTDSVRSIAYSPDGGRLATASADKTVIIWDIATGKQLSLLQGHSDGVNDVVFSLDGTLVISASDDKSVMIWNAENGELLHTLEGHLERVNSVSINHTGTRIATCSHDRTAKVWDLQSGALIYSLDGHSSNVNGASFSPNDKELATASADGYIRIWDTQSETLKQKMSTIRQAVSCVVYHSDGKRIASAFGSGVVRIWDPMTGMEVLTIGEAGTSILDAKYSPDGLFFATVSSDKTVKIWETETGTLKNILSGHSSHINSVEFSFDSKFAVTASKDRTAIVWDIATGRQLLTLRGHLGDIRHASFSFDGRSIVTASADKTVRIWCTQSGDPLQSIDSKEEAYHSAYTPDGKNIIFLSGGLVSTKYEGTINVWNVEKCEVTAVLDSNTGWIAYRSDGKGFATSNRDKTIKLWDFQSLSTIDSIKISSAPSIEGRFSSDCRFIAIGGFHTVYVIDLESKKPILSLKGHTDFVRSVSFSHDGSKIITSAQQEPLRIWDSKTGKTLDAIPNIPGLMVIGCYLRNLHPDSNFSDEDRDILRRYGAIID